MVEGASPVCATATDAAGELARLRDAMRDAGATLAGAGLHPAAEFGEVVHVREARYDEIHDSMRGLVERTPTCALARPCRDARSRDGDRDVQQAARPSAAAAGARRALAVLVRPRLRLRDRARPVVPRLPERGDPACVRGLGRLLRGRRSLARGRRDARLHLPVVGHPAAPAARHRRGAGDGRAVPSRLRRRARRARPRPRHRVRRRARRRRVPPRRSASPRSAPAATASRRRSGGRERSVRCARSRPRRSRWRARTRAPREGRSRRSSGSCATATARTACAAATRPAACGRCSADLVHASARPLYGYTRTTVPMRTHCRSTTRSGSARAGSRDWRCRPAPTGSRGSRSRG